MFFELFETLLEFEYVEALIGIKIIDLERFGDSLFLFKNFIELSSAVFFCFIFLFTHIDNCY